VPAGVPPSGAQDGGGAVAVAAPAANAAAGMAPLAAPTASTAKPSTEAPAGAAASPPAPAQQLAQAVATLQLRPNGGSHLTVRLAPAELGEVHIQITRGQDGAATVSVAASRPETLSGLQTDLAHLHQALDRAGVPEQRSLVFHLASEPARTGGEAGAGSGQSAPQEGGAAGGGFQHGPRQERPQPGQAPGSQMSSRLGDAEAQAGPAAPAGRPATAWRQAGIDYTA
jgi:hypothetical protein